MFSNVIHSSNPLADIKHDNILFRPLDVSKVVAHELAVKPSVTYDSGTEVCPAVVPVVSQILPLSIDGPIEEERLEAVIADVGHCWYPSICDSSTTHLKAGDCFG